MLPDRVSNLRVRCPTDCATRPGKYGRNRIIRKPTAAAVVFNYLSKDCEIAIYDPILTNHIL